MRIVMFGTAQEVAVYAADYIVQRIGTFQPTAERPFVLGLPTGSTPVMTYQRLIQAYREGRVSFKYVVTFNMDEYVGLPASHPESYHSFMHKNLFSFIDIPKENINILNGNAKDLVEECRRFEDKMKALGGVQLFVGGIGSDGHIAFNEPGSSLSSSTRVKSLNEETILANARFFGQDVSKVPTMALTVGVKTIMDAHSVLILATGAAKAPAVAQLVEGAVSHTHPITALQFHPRVVLCIDEASTADLKVKTVKYFKGLLWREKELEDRQKNSLKTAATSKL